MPSNLAKNKHLGSWHYRVFRERVTAMGDMREIRRVVESQDGICPGCGEELAPQEAVLKRQPEGAIAIHEDHLKFSE